MSKEYEGYELFCCKEALKIAEACKTFQGIMDFYNLSWDEQVNMVPTLSHDHSGNTFGAACMLAQIQIECPDRIHEMYGSLSPLVGSKAYEKQGKQN